MWTTGLLRACTRSNRGGWRLTSESWNHCDHVVLSSLVDLLDPGDREGDDQVIMENTMTIMSFDESGEWWVNGWTGPFRIIFSVLTALLQVQHYLAYILAYILHITHLADRAQRRTNPITILAWSCVIIEAKAGSSTGSQAAEELGWESQIKEVRFK